MNEFKLQFPEVPKELQRSVQLLQSAKEIYPYAMGNLRKKYMYLLEGYWPLNQDRLEEFSLHIAKDVDRKMRSGKPVNSINLCVHNGSDPFMYSFLITIHLNNTPRIQQ